MEGKPGKGGGGGKKGLAPFASLEDLSDESPPDDKCRLTLPGIKEDPTPAPAGSGQRPSITPRIDISRASSSSHHDDSSPERELFAGTSEGASGAKIGLGFTEEMAMELRSSTEELDFHDPEEETKTRRKKLHHQHQAVTKYELEAQSEKECHERKDSACSEGGLLLIGGRTSRLSSVGSVASGGSIASHVSGGSGISNNSHLSATSHVSGHSHLSAVSNYSRASRCSSPHRMLLETSFCGPKPIPTLSLEAEYPPDASVEAALLARKTDITGAILPIEESVKVPVSASSKTFTGKASLNVRSGSKSSTLDVKTKQRSASERIAKPSSSLPVQARSSSARANLKQSRPPKAKKDEDALVRIIPLHGSIDEPESNDTDQGEKEEEQNETTTTTDSGAFTPEYGIYIPLKGPIIDYGKAEEVVTQIKPKPEPESKKPEIEESDLVRFISLHGDDDEDIQREKTDNVKKFSFRNGQNVQFKPWTDDTHLGPQRERQIPKKSRSPEPTSKSNKPTTLNITSKNGRPVQSLTQLPRDESRTPSPAASFARGVNLFRRSSDSSGSSKKSAQASGSSDKLRKDTRNKSMFTSLFKKNVKEAPPPPQQKRVAQDKTAIDPNITNVEFKFKHENGDSIIIPLHSPDSVTEPLLKFDPEAISVVEETEVKPKKPVKKEYYEKKSPIMPLSENHISGKSIVVVDVTKEDKCEPLKSPVVAITQKSHAQEKTDSKKMCKLELEDLEYEPRVRRSSNVSTKEEEKVNEKLVIEEKQEAKEISEDIQIIKYVEVVRLEGINVEEVTEVKKAKTSKTPMESLVISPSEEKPLLEEMISDRSQGEEVTKDETEERRSSESEVEQLPIEKPKEEECDEERKGLFLQNDSVEEELPYVPTTLPQERSVAVPIIPIRQRMTEVKTCPLDRPRSTTPIQPSNLEEYAATHDGSRPSRNEKMQITLPRTDSLRSKSPGRAKPWTQFAEECLQSPKETRKVKVKGKNSECPPPSTPPPLPPRGSSHSPSSQWVMFDEQPERRRTPRRITTLPLRQQQQQSSSSVVYSYVNPEECSCECHESQGKVISAQCLTDTEQCSYKKGNRTEKERRNRT